MKSVNRLKASEDFALAIKKGKTYRNESFTIHILKNECEHARVGISVSAKIENAVNRNRIKRQVRAMCDELIKYNECALDIVIIVRKPYMLKSFDDNNKKLKELLNI